MTSRHSGEWSRGEDLIDFEVGSPETQGNLTASSPLLDEEKISETLLDSELLRLEETLQTASSSPQTRSRCDSRDSVELEQVLISIEDDDLFPSKKKSTNASSPKRRRSCNSSEIVDALRELDKIINDSLTSSSTILTDLDGPDETDGLPTTSLNESAGSVTIEDCLRDLDSYLQSFDTSGSDVGENDSLSDHEKEQKKKDTVSSQPDNQMTERLRRLASHTRSLRQNGRMNNGYERSETSGKINQDDEIKLKRNHPLRATIAAMEKSQRQSNSEKTATNSQQKDKNKGSQSNIHRKLKNSQEKPSYNTWCAENPKRRQPNIDHLSADSQKTDSKDKKSDKRPLSADCDQGLKRNNRFRSTIAVTDRSKFIGKRKSIPAGEGIERSEQRISGARDQGEYDTDDEEIDWSWVQEVGCDVTPQGSCDDVPSTVTSQEHCSIDTQSWPRTTNKQPANDKQDSEHCEQIHSGQNSGNSGKVQSNSEEPHNSHSVQIHDYSEHVEACGSSYQDRSPKIEDKKIEHSLKFEDDFPEYPQSSLMEEKHLEDHRQWMQMDHPLMVLDLEEKPKDGKNRRRNTYTGNQNCSMVLGPEDKYEDHPLPRCNSWLHASFDDKNLDKIHDSWLCTISDNRGETSTNPKLRRQNAEDGNENDNSQHQYANPYQNTTMVNSTTISNTENPLYQSSDLNPSQNQNNTANSESENHNSAVFEDKKVEENRIRGASSWLRSSMRRVRHFRLPSDPLPSEIETVVSSSKQNSLQNASRNTFSSNPVVPNVQTLPNSFSPFDLQTLPNPEHILFNSALLRASIPNLPQLSANNAGPTLVSNLNSNASVSNASVSNASVSNASVSNASGFNASVSNASVFNASVSNASVSNASVSNVSSFSNGQTLSSSLSMVPNSVTSRNSRPVSAPVRTSFREVSSGVSRSRSRSRSRESEVSTAPGGRARSSSESSRSRRRARSLSSSDSSLASSVDSTPSCTPVSSPTHTTPVAETVTNNTRRSCDRQRDSEMPNSHSQLGQWPHSLSSMLACLGCTLGLFNVSRFAVLTVRFGANFIIQFLILTLVFGIPLFTLQLCLGQQLGAGVVDMWRISPLFQGVGIALLAAQAFIGLYSIVGISWMFIYFRDAFITKQDQYRWAQPYDYYRSESRAAMNGTYKISETVPDYFSGVVLQRHNLVTGNSFGAIKFQVAFNLAVVWMIVFVSLSKGLRSYAKVVYVFTLLPIFGTFILCAKLLGMTPTDSLHEVFPETNWAEFFLNSKSWIAASQEVFLTWGVLGAAIMQLASHNKHKHLLQRDSSLVIILTITILMLTAFLSNTCIEILHFYGYNYMPNSFERISTYIFLRPSKDPLPPSLSSTPVRYMTHSSFMLGERVLRPGMDRTDESGYQVLRFATELVPATLALLGPAQISPFWAVLFYFILILFGIAQQLAIWHCVITGIMAIRAKVLKSWETTITFFTCTFGFILGLPMTTELGIYVVYFLDYTVGGTWWLVLVYLLQIIAVFMVRGRPYSGDTVVTALFTANSSSCVQTWLAPMLSFTWNVILPVALMTVCITQFKSGNFKELFVWHHAPSLEYWPTWTRQIGSLLQLMPLLCVPIVAIIQSYRYLNNGPPDILDRIQLLYRPPLDSEHLDDLAIQQAAAATANTTNTTTTVTNIPAEDPPPKYTPPPSYTTATGARIAKLLRQSIRRSVRRLANVLGESSTPRVVERPQLQVPPPDYSAVLVEMNQSRTQIPHITVDVTDGREGNASPIRNERSVRREGTMGREGNLAPIRNQNDRNDRNSTNERMSREISNLHGSPLTAADVASILRSSFRRSTINRVRRSALEDTPSGSLSAECLVDGIAPLGEDSLVLDTISQGDNEIESKPPNDDRSSVI